MVVPSASTLDTLARLPPVPASAPLSCYVIFNSKSLFGAVLFLNWEDCRFYVMQDGCTDRSRFDSISLALESISRFKKPGVEAVAVRQCSELYGPAIFLSEDDCSFFLVQKAGEPLVVYQKFKYLLDAVKFITDEYISDGTDEDDKEDDDDDDDDEDDDVLLIELKEHDVGRKKFAAVHSKMPTDIDEEDDDELEEDDHLTTTPIDLGANKEQNKELEAENKVPTQEPDELEEDGDDKHEKDRISDGDDVKNGGDGGDSEEHGDDKHEKDVDVNGGDGGDNDGDDIDSDDNNDDDDDHNKGDEDYIPAEDPDNNELKKVATASAHHLIPTTEKQRTSSLVNLYTNGLDLPKYNQLHKAQQPVAADAPGFREALENIVIPAEMMFLYQHCLAKPKESFFISATAHIQVISKACGLSPQEMIKMRGWVFLKKKSSKGAPYRYQSFSDSVYETMLAGAANEFNPRILVYRFQDVVEKMRTGYTDMTSKFPQPIVVPSRKTSKKRGQEGQPLAKYHRGLSIKEEDMLAVQNYSKKIRNYFEKYHLGVCSVHAIFANVVLPDYALFFPLCNKLFHFCHTETSYIATLHDALRVFYGPYSISEDGVASKQSWIESPHLFSVQLLLKLGKVGVLSLESYEEVVSSDFYSLMDNKEKKTAGNFTARDNAVLIRYRVQSFYKQQVANSKTTNKGNKSRRSPALSSKTSPAKKSPPAPTAKMPIDTPAPAPPKVAPPGFLNLLNTQAERKLPPSSTIRKLGLLKFASSGRGSSDTILPLNPHRPVVNNEMAIEDDLGPFESAAPETVKAFGPVLVILPDDGGVDMVLVELSPLDVYYRESLRLDSHSMTYMSSVPSFEEMRRLGYSFQFYSSTKDFVSDSFAVLRGATNPIVATVMDQVMPLSHSYLAHFKLLAHHGDYQVKRDSCNRAGGVGKGYRVDLGACDHNYTGENTTGLGPTPRTNGGVKCFNVRTGDDVIDSAREDLREYFGCQMDAVQLIVDKVRQENGYKRIFNDFTREESFASKLREELKATYSRAEVSSNFVTLLDGNDGCSYHKDAKNCSRPSYDWTCCVATTVQSTSSGRLYRAVTNLNSREACGRAMEEETKFASFKLGLEAEMERIDSSYKEIFGERVEDVPTAQTFTDLYLKDDLPWIEEADDRGNLMRYISAATAPSRDLFLSTATSAVYNLRQQDEDLGCTITVGFLFIALYMSSYQHFNAILAAIKEDEGLLEMIRSDLPGTYWEVSERLFPSKFWSGKNPRFSPSGIDFKKLFVENKTNFEVAVGEMKELLKLVNTTIDPEAVPAKIKEMAGSYNLPGLNVFRLQLFVPLAALCGLVLHNNLFHADYIKPAEGVHNGSYAALNNAGFEMHRHSDTLLNICGQVGLPRRHSLGECLTCESHRGIKRYDLFLHGQDLFHLFLLDTVFSVQQKVYNSNEWVAIATTTLAKLQSEDCA